MGARHDRDNDRHLSDHGQRDPAAEAGTRSIGVAVQLPNPKETLRAGQYAVAQVQIGDATPRSTVPIGAISSAWARNTCGRWSRAS